jgi:plastocyanin
MKSFYHASLFSSKERIMLDKNKNSTEKSLTIGLFIVAITGLGLSGSIIIDNNNQAQAQQVNNITRVAAGGGNSTDVKTAFIPQSVEIQAGQTINWFNPTPVGEPHSVTFLKNNSLFPPFAAPFAVPNSTQFKALMPNPNLEPLIVPNPPGIEPTSKTVIIDNARAFNPTVIDSTGQNVTYLPINKTVNYTMDGTETYLNSGYILPEGQNPPEAPPINEFTVTFENPGTYNYLCTVHPWMTGTVVVS